MKNLALVLGLAGTVSLALWACGSEVNETGAGGSGGTTTTTTSTGGGGAGGASSSSSSSSSTSGAGGFANDCEAACNKIEVDCGFGSVCSQIPFLQCGDPNSECPGGCILASDCAAIASLVNYPNSDPDLMACLQACQGGGDPCQTCVLSSCSAELQACQGDTACQAFLGCLQSCQPNDTSCFTACAASNPGTATDVVVSCAANNCNTECYGGGGGGGGGVGGGGVGGGGGGGVGGGGGGGVGGAGGT